MTQFRLFSVALCLSVGSVLGAPVKIACVGDSITEGAGLSSPGTQSYPARLQRLLGTNYVVKNYGVSGRTLLKQGDFPYWKEAFFKQSHDFYPDIVIIQLGTNDSKPQNWRYSTNFVADYEELIAGYSILTNAPQVYLCTPCPVYASGAYDIRPGVIATNIVPMVRELSQRLSLPLIDLHTRLAGHSEWFPDTVHPNSRGMTAMAAIMFSALEPEDAKPERVLTMRPLSPTRITLSWPSQWGSLVPQYANAINGTNSTWTVLDTAIPYSNSADLIQLTNASTGAPKFFRLWRP